MAFFEPLITCLMALAEIALMIVIFARIARDKTDETPGDGESEV